MSNITPDKKLAAVCGLFCPSCTLYIGTHEDPARLKWLADYIGKPVEEMQCNGCRSDKRSYYCKDFCQFVDCAKEKGIDFCGECDQFPCENLKEFQQQMPHRAELWDDHAKIKDIGFEAWFSEKMTQYSCEKCETINSAYDVQCRKCGNTPGSDFVEKHFDLIHEHMKKTLNKK